MTPEEILEIAHRRCTMYTHVDNHSRYRFSDHGMIEFAQEIERRTKERCAAVCDAQQLEPECPERAAYCAEAIRGLK